MASRNRVHFDATQTSGGLDLRRSMCGWIGVSTTTDVTAVTCRACLTRLRDERAQAAPARGDGLMDPAELARELHADLALGQTPTLSPTAGPPPRLTPQLWALSCRGGTARCRDCTLCAWQDDVERWAYAAPWTRRHSTRREGSPRWPSLSAALLALIEYEQSGRDRGSALGGILARIEHGEAFGARDVHQESREIRAASDIVHVRVALERAFDAGHFRISAEDCQRVLLERTPGLLLVMTPYEALRDRYGLPIGELQSIVRRGRRAMEEDLAGRGLIPVPRIRARVVESEPTWSAPDAL